MRLPLKSTSGFVVARVAGEGGRFRDVPIAR